MLLNLEGYKHRRQHLIKISPYQSVQIFGWWAQPRLTLAWDDIKHRNISWRALRELGFEPGELKSIQPDKTAWIQRGGLHLNDIVDMVVFPVNPLTDFRADLAELWNLKCSPALLREMGVTFKQLLMRGLNPDIMYFFNFTYAEWIKLGMLPEDIKNMSETNCVKVFGVGNAELLQIYEDFRICDDLCE